MATFLGSNQRGVLYDGVHRLDMGSSEKLLLVNWYTDLERWATIDDRWLNLWTALVVLGVALELLVIWKEYRSDLRDFRRATIRSPERPSILKVLLELFGAGLVTIGVAGEFFITKNLGEIESHIRTISRRQVSLADGDAAVAIRRTVELESENLRLQQQIQPRELTTSARDQIRKALERNRVKVQIIAYGGDVESMRLAQELEAITKAKENDVVVGISFSGSEIVYGARVCRLSPWPEVAEAIAVALGASLVVDLRSGYPVNCAPDALSVFIGAKPLPSDRQEKPAPSSLRPLRSLDENAQLRIASSLAPFRGVVAVTYLEVVPDSPELAGQVYRVLGKAVPDNKGIVNDLTYRDSFDLPPDPVGIEVRHTSDGEATAFAEAITSALEREIHGVRVFPGLKMPFTSLPLNDPARSRVVVRIGRNP